MTHVDMSLKDRNAMLTHAKADAQRASMRDQEEHVKSQTIFIENNERDLKFGGPRSVALTPAKVSAVVPRGSFEA